MRKVIGIGETVYDIIFQEDQPVAAKPGGSTFNALISLGRIGIPAQFISETGNDKVGDIIMKFLSKNGIGTQYITRFKDGKTALSLAFLNAQSDADYLFYKNYPKQRLTAGLPQAEQDDFILFGSFFALNPALRPQVLALLENARQNNAIIYYDPNFRSSHAHELEELLPVLRENFNAATLIRGSDEDFQAINKTADLATIYKETCFNRQPLIYTMSSKGVIVKVKEAEYRFAVPQIKPVSTIGAGDNFNAGVAYALFRYNILKSDLAHLDYKTWKRIIDIAMAFSTEVCLSYDNYISIKFANHLKQIIA